MTLFYSLAARQFGGAFLLIVGLAALLWMAPRWRGRILAAVRLPDSGAGLSGGMSILQRYVMRESFWPILLSFVSLTFILLIQGIYELVDLLMASGDVMIVLKLLMILLPATLPLTLPISILIGTLLGIGRMAADNEILACQISGVHLGRILWPLVGMAGIASVAVMFINYEITPRANMYGKTMVQKVTYQKLSTMEPGIPWENESTSGENMTFFFRERDSETNDMLGFRLLVNHQVGSFGSRVDTANEGEAGESARGDRARRSRSATEDTADGAMAPGAAAWAASPEKITTEEFDALTSSQQEQLRESTLAAKQTRAESISSGRHEIIFASRGTVELPRDREAVVLHLFDGSIHSMGEDFKSSHMAERIVELAEDSAKAESRDFPASPTMTVDIPRENPMRFERMEYDIDFSQVEAKRKPSEMTVRQMIRAVSLGRGWPEWRFEPDEDLRKHKRRYQVEWSRRTAIPLACVSFVLLGIPLAIFMRPSGKALGLITAFSLILVYYWFIQMGSAAAEEGNSVGFFIIFVPNLAMAALGAFLLRRAVRM